MSDQATWIPLPRRRASKAKLPDVLQRADRLIDWYEANKPRVKRLAVVAADYVALEESVGTHNVTLTKEGIRYRGFTLYRSDTSTGGT